LVSIPSEGKESKEEKKIIFFPFDEFFGAGVTNVF